MVYCVNCGSENPEHAKYCYKCGKPIWQPASADKPPQQSTSPNPSANDSFIGKTCPYCQVPFKPGADVVSCQNCHMPHHRECWSENGNKCTTFGCTSNVSTPAKTEKARSDNRIVNYREEPAVKNGKIITSPYDYVGSYFEGFASVKKNGRWGIINQSGKEIVKTEYEEVTHFAEGFARIKDKGLWGYVSKTGQLVIPMQFEEAYGFINGVAQVKKNGQIGVIDRDGSFRTTTCFVATVVYKDIHAHELQVLRKFRDELLLKTLPGKAFVNVYYIVGPYLAEMVINNRLLYRLIRNILDRIVKRLNRGED